MGGQGLGRHRAQGMVGHVGTGTDLEGRWQGACEQVGGEREASGRVSVLGGVSVNEDR